MITATDLEVRAGARILLAPDGPDLRVQPGDRIGLVGRNGAGKTTTLRILAGEVEPYAGSVTRAGEIGYLPQDPKVGDLDVLARDRVLSARGLDVLLTDLEKQQALMAEVADEDERDRAIRRYGQLEERFVALGGYGAESEAGRICASLGLPERVLTQRLRTLSGGQRRRVELARILFAASESGAGNSTTLLLDEPTNHLDADSLGWLRDFLRLHTGGLVVISHNVDLVADVVNKVWFLDAVRGQVDVYNMGWQRYVDARATDEQRRIRERANAERKAAALRAQAAKLGAKATKAVAAQNMLRRADRMMAALDEERVADK
ncbi:ABC-F family ATP-binding cassette domain-containing protein, partial [Mycobacterium tuberculosis]|nr:ABC-F family ATP-binding cassette domain-containing protein [Mycobacterium tuberculosis]